MLDVIAWGLGVFSGFLLGKLVTKNSIDIFKQIIVEWRDDVFNRDKEVKK